MKSLRLLIDMIDWEYPAEKKSYPLEHWDLGDAGDLEKMALALGNGIVIEMRAVAESYEALERLRGLLRSVGSCKPVELDAEWRERLWLCQEGDECWRQPGKNPGHMFLDPAPRPERFGVK